MNITPRQYNIILTSLLIVISFLFVIRISIRTHREAPIENITDREELGTTSNTTSKELEPLFIQSVVCTRDGKKFYKVDYEYNEYADTIAAVRSSWMDDKWEYAEKTEYEYNKWGQRISETTYRYEDLSWRCVCTKRFEYNGDLLVRTSQDDGNDEKTTFAYRNGQLIKKVTISSGEDWTEKDIESFEYTNNVLSKKTCYHNEIDDAYITNITFYDNYGRPTKSNIYNGHNGDGGFLLDYTDYDYNSDGTLSKEEGECYEGDYFHSTTTYSYNDRKEKVRTLYETKTDYGRDVYDFGYSYTYIKMKPKTHNVPDKEVAYSNTSSSNSEAPFVETKQEIAETNNATSTTTQPAVTANRIDETAERIVIDKPALQLRVYGADDNLIASFGIACGRNKGNKMGNGDCKTPEGDFHVCKIQDASSWCHDFKDGAGLIKGAYGPYFFRLEGETLPAKTGIGIHGTHNPNSIGTRCTEGCIRLRNEDLLTLHKYIRVGIPVKILPD